MRTLYPVVLTIAIGLAGLMFALSGANAGWGQDPAGVDQVGDKLNSSAANGSVRTGVENRGNNDNTLLGAAISAGTRVVSILKIVFLLPFALQSLGFPGWFAIPIGTVVSLWVSIGVLQFVTQRVLR